MNLGTVVVVANKRVSVSKNDMRNDIMMDSIVVVVIVHVDCWMVLPYGSSTTFVHLCVVRMSMVGVL